MSQVWAVIEIIKQFFKYLGIVIGLIDKANDKKAAEKSDKLDEAVDKSKTAQTKEEMINAQKDIIDSGNY